MSDDTLSFFDDPIDSPSPAPSPSPDPTGDPAAPPSPGASADQIAAMQTRLENAERWREDVGRMLLGQNGQPQQQQQEDPQVLLQQLLTNPQEVLQNTVAQSVTAAQEAMRNQAIIDDRRAKHPEISKLEGLINWETAMQSAAQSFYQQHGRNPSFAETLDGAIESVKSGLQGILPGGQQPNPGTNRQVMNMDIAGGNQPSNTRAVDPFSMTDAEWAKNRHLFRGGQ